MGFLGSLSAPESCELKCDDGQFPRVTFEEVNDNENVISGTECTQCDETCATCMGAGSESCTSCPSDGIDGAQYLAIANITSQYGSCLTRLALADGEATPSFDIFVSKEEPAGTFLEQSANLADPDTVGSISNPFY